jgi:hypothetical protein
MSGADNSPAFQRQTSCVPPRFFEIVGQALRLPFFWSASDALALQFVMLAIRPATDSDCDATWNIFREAGTPEQGGCEN